MKNILYISSLCSPRVIDYIFNTSVIKPGLAVQKFHRLLAEGLAFHNKYCCVETLSIIPVVSKSHHQRLWNIPSEVIDNIHYKYIPTINLPVLKNVIIFIYAFSKTTLWNLVRRREDKVAIFDVRSLTVTTSALLACKLTNTKTIAIVTDVPNLTMRDSYQQNDVKSKVINSFITKIIGNFDGYLLLTEPMNEVVNRHHKPYIIMEGLVDAKMVANTNLLEHKSSERILIYAGGIYEKYGIKKLIEAFSKLEDDDLRLHIYGHGEMEKDMPYYMSLDKRVVYRGIVSNNIVVERQLEATLLINPRSSTEEFTKYSFPSKNMEYMASGTPIVTTLLPGMPKEYIPFVYLFTDESIDGIYQTLNNLLLKPKEELNEFGYHAKQFVLENKSNYSQAKRLLSFLEEIDVFF